MSAEDNIVTDEELAQAAHLLTRINAIFSEKVVGQGPLKRSLVAGLLAGGHVLLESVPGLAKTTAAQTLAAAVSGSFHRIQCTPDLMPNDIIGTQIFNFQSGDMTTQLGPVHANLVLLDEINRSSAKTQSAMLEAMQERQTSIGGTVYPLPKPFMVIATQNPIEEEGTYVLPEAQMDRFLIKEVLSYPAPQEELQVLDLVTSGALNRRTEGAPISLEEVEYLQGLTARVFVHQSIRTYIIDLINTTRGGGPNPVKGFRAQVRVGASPRGAIALLQVAQALALMAGRNYATPQDVKAMRFAVLRHRLIRTYDAMAANMAPESLIDAVFNAVAVP